MSRTRNHWAYKDAAYLRARAALLSQRPVCHEPNCDRLATVADHFPPLSAHDHRRGGGCCGLRPHCQRHSSIQGGTIAAHGTINGAPPEPDAEPVGLGPEHPLWALPWIEPFTSVPSEATWPRLMTPPHPRAVGSLGEEFISWAQDRTGKPLRWWQRLAATRLLEVDAAGGLVWPAALLSTARQVGKSWLLRELMLWRIHQSPRFGEPQLVVHIGNNRAVAREVQRAARMWARELPEFSVTSANGYELIEHEDGSRWIIKSRAGAYGHSSSFVAVDEAWDIKTEEVEEAMVPTLAETASAQLLLVSTANTRATSLMLGRRRSALERLDEPGEGDLLVEWSAAPGADFTNPAVWRQASPHWSEQRERLIAGAVRRAINGDSDDPRQDPTASVKSQWLNRWAPAARRDDRGERLLSNGVWWGLRTAENCTGTRWTIALEDNYGSGAAVAVCGDLDEDRWLLAGWRFDARADALAKVSEVNGDLPNAQLVVGASMSADPDVAALPISRVLPGAGPRTRQGLALLRELAGEGRIGWDPADGVELAAGVDEARVVERAHGLVLLGPRLDLLTAVAWALAAQAKPSPQPAIR